MPVPAASADLYRAQQRRVMQSLMLARRLWDGAGSDAARARVVPRLTVLLATSMVGAAADGAGSVGVALAQSGFPVDPVARVEPRAFASSASDGRPLESLLRVAMDAASAGGPDAGRVVLDRIVHTQIGDATRAASQVGIVARPHVGWVRMVNPPCCQDCAVQAGRWFRWNDGFRRHPNCDCVHRPAHESEPPRGYAQSVDPAQIKDLTGAQRVALDEGADLGRVVNAYRRVDRVRGRVAAGARERMVTTTERAPSGASRLTPDGIVRRARDRDEAVSLLREYGYLL